VSLADVRAWTTTDAAISETVKGGPGPVLPRKKGSMSIMVDRWLATAETVGLDTPTGQALMKSLNARLGLTDRRDEPEQDTEPRTLQ
jgi:hypothetical protein